MHIEPAVPTIARVARARGAAVAALSCAALLSACGSSSSSTSSTAAGTPLKTPVNIPQLEAAIRQSILTQRHLQVTKVACPTTLPNEVGKTFECLVTTTTTTTPAKIVSTPFIVTIDSNRGHVKYEGK